MNKHSGKSRKQRFVRLIVLILLIGLACSALSFFAIRSEWDSTIEDPTSVEVLIVLGAGIWGDQPSPQLKLRLQAAAILFKKNPELSVIVSGGQGPDEDISEASAMQAYLIQLGVAEESILLEDQSTSTVENLRFSKIILDGLKLDNPSVGIVTTDFHMYRSKMLAKRYGMNAMGESAPNVPIIVVKNTMREIAAVIKDTILH